MIDRNNNLENKNKTINPSDISGDIGKDGILEDFVVLSDVELYKIYFNEI
jgi:hypothetical protein